MAPIVAALIKFGLPVLASAVAAKGKEVIQEKLGVDIEDALGSEEGRFKLRELEISNEQFLITSAIEDKKLDLADTASAREMNSRVQESGNSSQLAKNAAYILDFMVVGSTIILGLLLFVMKLPSENKELALTVFGALLTLSSTVIQFHRGSSRNSQSKDATIQALSGVKGEQQ